MIDNYQASLLVDRWFAQKWRAVLTVAAGLSAAAVLAGSILEIIARFP